MSSPSELFECHWRTSCRLLVGYGLVQGLAWLAIGLVQAPMWVTLGAMSLCVGQALWVLPRQILLTHPQAMCGVRHDAQGWWLWNAAHGWQAVQLRQDSMAWPALIILRYRFPGRWYAQGVCIVQDALPHALHRQLRVRLKFSRRRWAAPE